MKFIRRDYTAFVGIPSTRAEIQDFMCSEIADMIVSSETGWEYDTRTPNKTAFIRIPSVGGDTYQAAYPVIYLKNSTSGCKMMVTSVFPNVNTGYVDEDHSPISGEIFFRRNSSTYSMSGVGISVIPPGVDYEYPNSFNSDTEFDDGVLRVFCESVPYYSDAAYTGGYQYFLTLQGQVVSYGILIDGYGVTLLGCAKSSTRGMLNGIYTTGKCFGTLAYDSEIQSQYYGSIRYANIGPISYFMYNAVQLGASSFSLYGVTPESDSQSDNQWFDNAVECFDQTGNRVQSCLYGACGQGLLSTKVTDSNSPDFIRWCPGVVYNAFGDAPSAMYDGGDKFKGYLDTNIIRYAIASQGQLFNNGQFCCVADNLLMKWDPDAEDTINA